MEEEAIEIHIASLEPVDNAVEELLIHLSTHNCLKMGSFRTID